MLRCEVGVAHRHRQAGVAEDLLERLEAPALHHEPAREAVPAVVEPEVVHLRLDDGVLERGPDTPGAEESPLAAGEARQDAVDDLPHGNLAALAALRDLEAD